MSQSSETTWTRLQALNYPEQSWYCNYYTARVRPGVGVCIAELSDLMMVQLFPWPGVDIHRDDNMVPRGHEAYAAFITAKATTAEAQDKELFCRWPFQTIKDNTDLLVVKCAIEHGLQQAEDYNANHPSDSSDATAGQAVE